MISRYFTPACFVPQGSGGIEYNPDADAYFCGTELYFMTGLYYT